MHYASATRVDPRWEGATAEARQLNAKGFNPFKKPGEQGEVLNAPRDSDNKSPTEENEAEISKEIPSAASSPTTLEIADNEYVQASRAVRTASWGAVFYLITTDVLGPWSTG